MKSGPTLVLRGPVEEHFGVSCCGEDLLGTGGDDGIVEPTMDLAGVLGIEEVDELLVVERRCVEVIEDYAIVFVFVERLEIVYERDEEGVLKVCESEGRFSDAAVAVENV